MCDYVWVLTSEDGRDPIRISVLGVFDSWEGAENEIVGMSAEELTEQLVGHAEVRWVDAVGVIRYRAQWMEVGD